VLRRKNVWRLHRCLLDAFDVFHRGCSIMLSWRLGIKDSGC
jgi:hypothetical protein